MKAWRFLLLCLLLSFPLEAEEIEIILDPGREITLMMAGGQELLVRARIQFPQLAGAAYLMQVTADGRPLEPLANKAQSFQYRDGRTFPYQEGGVWNVFYSPDFVDNDVSIDSYQVTTDPGQAYLYRWKVPGQPDERIAIRIRHIGTHRSQAVEHPLVLGIFGGDSETIDGWEREMADMKMSTAKIFEKSVRRRGKGRHQTRDVAAKPAAEVTGEPTVEAPVEAPPEISAKPASGKAVEPVAAASEDVTAPRLNALPVPPPESRAPVVELPLGPGKSLQLDVPAGARMVMEARMESSASSGSASELKVTAAGQPLRADSEFTKMTVAGQRYPYEWLVPGQAGTNVNVTIFHQAPPGQPNVIIKLMGTPPIEAETDTAQALYNKMLTFLQMQGMRPTRRARPGDVWNVVVPESDEAGDL